MITITIDGHSAQHVRAEMARLLGVADAPGAATVPGDAGYDAESTTSDSPETGRPEKLNPIKVPDEPITEQQAEALVEQAHGNASEQKPVRERGKPSPGKARRTKEEIAEDEAADKADAELRAAGEETDAIVPDKHVETDDDATAEQDAADEAAETDAEAKELTLDDLRKAVGVYAHKFGVAAASEDIRDIIGFPMIECPEDKLADSIAKVQNAVRLNPKGRDVLNSAAPTAADAAKPAGKRTATKEDVGAALLRYALKHDGQNTDTANMPIMTEDGRKCLAMRFGENITKLSQLTTPEEFGQALTDIESMIAKNPFNREVKVA